MLPPPSPLCFYLFLFYKLPQIIQSPLIYTVATSVTILASLLGTHSDLSELSIKIPVLPDLLVQILLSLSMQSSVFSS